MDAPNNPNRHTENGRENVVPRTMAPECTESTRMGSVVQKTANQRRQGIYWIATIPYSDWTPELADGINWVRGQHERGESGYEHWQCVIGFKNKQSLTGAKKLLGVPTAHLELCRSAAADDYVWKEDTRVGEQFDLGKKPFQRNNSKDWDMVRDAALQGRLEEIPSDIFIRYYGNLCKIRSDHLQPIAGERRCNVYWGPTGTGKSRKAWELAGIHAYSKDPRTKFWCGYVDQRNVVVDEFRGGIDISHMLRWLDRYPVRVEVKGGSKPLAATEYWITSNLHPYQWYPELDRDTYSALERRLTIEEFKEE